MADPNEDGPTWWGSNANSPVGWIVGALSVLTLIVALYLYAMREKASSPGRPPNETSGLGDPSAARPARPRK